MHAYKNRSGNSGIHSYEIGIDYILIKFSENEEVYKYSYSVTGKYHVDTMKKLAVKGKGLATYIAENPSVKNRFQKV